MEAFQNRNGELVIDGECARELIPVLLTAHSEQSDSAAYLLAQLLEAFGDVHASAGRFGHDYCALIDYDEQRWLVEANNAWTRVYDPAEAEYDVLEQISDMAD
jgi:hypothetical protein